jgi:putative ABC transport system permease protein
MSWCSRIINVVRGERSLRQVDDELQSHIQEAIEKGRDPEEARRAFGSIIQQRERSRDMKIVPWLDSLRADAVFGWRQLKKNKVTSAAAILSLALAIGACSSAFRLIDAVLLRPLPIADPERLEMVGYEGLGADGKLMIDESSSYPLFERMRTAVKDQAELIAVSYADRIDITYGSDQEMEKVYFQFVSGTMFDSFGLRPALGRLLAASDDVTPGASPVAALSHDYWTRRFGRDTAVIGRTVRIGDGLYEIIGVAPERFTGVETGTMTDVFVPMMMKNPRTLASPNNFWLRAFVRRKPGVAAGPVLERLRAIFRTDQEERVKAFPALPQPRLKQMLDRKLVLEPASAGRSLLQRDYRRSLVAMGILVALVLLIACANVANLMTAQAAARAREMALRVSIGAGRGRLMQLVLMESAWLAFLATVLGALFAWWSAPFIVRMIQTPSVPARLALPADWRVLGFTVALALGTTLLFGIAPALRASAVQPVSALKGGEAPHARRRMMYALIAMQVAFCFVVHLVAGLFVTTFDRLSHQPIGFSPERILNLETLTRQPQPAVFWDQVAERLRNVPGVETVALTGFPVMSGESVIRYISVNGAAPSEVYCDVLNISPGWMDTMKIPLLDGRDFRENDTAPGVAIVNEAFAKQYFGGENPAGKWFEKVDTNGSRVRVQIVGYVRDARSRDNLRLPIRPTTYTPFHNIDAAGALQPIGRGTFVVRTVGRDPLALASTLRQEAPRARSEFRVSNIRTQVEIIESRTVRERLLAMLALFFATVALLLAGIGLYGVLDYSVAQRRREIGIRLAIGARAGHIARSVTAEVVFAVLVGALAGLALGVGAARPVEALLYQVSATDPGMLTLPSLTIFAAALLAALPAVVRALRIDPAVILRGD